MHKRTIAAAIAAISGFALAVPLTSLPAAASSHREAPTIAGDPNADNTDVYAFVSPDAQSTVTLVANYWPFENPAGGPNFYPFADDVQYNIHVDNVGDATDHIVFTYTFRTSTVNSNTFLYNVGPMTFANGTYANWNRPQTYELDMTVNGTKTVLGTNLKVPPDNVGPHSVGSPTAYDTLAKGSISTLAGGIKSFAGQRSDPFFVDLGGAFDLLSLGNGKNYLAGYNVNSLVIQVPKTMLDGPNGDHTIGVWATSSRSQLTTVNANGSRTGSGGLVQVSRLGNPLVNEVVMDYQLKDAFNGLAPVKDHTIPAVVDRVVHPELAGLLIALGIDPNAPPRLTTTRSDLVTVFLTGIPGINKPKNPNQVPAEMLRLNYSIAASSTNPNAVNRLGVLGGQLDGFPNGRRLADDVTDIELQAVAGILCQPGGALQTNPPCRTSKVNPAFGDGVNAADTPFQSCFPYLANPKGPNGSGGPVSTCPGATFPATAAVKVPPTPPLAALGLLALMAIVAVAGAAIYRSKANA